MTDLEDLIVKEANRQGCAPNLEAIRQAGIDLAGATMTSQGLIHLPGRGSISPADFTRSLRHRMPESFGELNAKPASNNLTERMRALVARSANPLPTDWDAVRRRYANSTLTATMMDELAASRRRTK
jgi:hypothetical protein